jgi:predicted transposase/invertase (TIGR01784 family)
MGKENFIRFDWAMKRLLRQKVNFVVLEGFLTSLLGEAVRIRKILDGEGNQEEMDDKFNRVDILAENERDELIIIEVQNNRELDYFHRMLYGTSKLITEYIHLGEEYERVKKVYSVNIVYFELGVGKDYVYHGYTEFRGLHNNDVLQLSDRQKAQFHCEKVGDIYPEYYVLRVEDFDKVAVTPLDEWILFLKTGEIPSTSQANGLPEARERLLVDRMSPEERRRYYTHMENLRYQRSVIKTSIGDGRAEGFADGLEQGRNEEKRQIVLNSIKAEIPVGTIVAITGLTASEVEQIISAE